MLFTYTYRSSDGQRRTAEIEAESRDAAFERVRAELGIKPIKVVAAVESGGALGERALPNGRDKRDRWIWGAAILAAAILAASVGAWWLLTGRAARPEAAPYQVMTPQGAVTVSVATPLPRQTIPGDRRRIEVGRDTIFTNTAERLLARFAEPGRTVAASEGAKPTDAEFAACLREPIRIASTDFTEVVDLKRIVSGMKREMRAYIAGGGTVEQYLAELEKRQRLEISYRENAEKRLAEMLNGQDARSPGGRDSLKAAYAYWLKANAQLQAMGIYPLALPDALRSYQMSLDIEE
ncbi:MAG: hypothetical protein IJL17_18655 [Kiritimatiellae bacterium]|nr:hypothetical protein [Kiritimatiellia bacterium]